MCACLHTMHACRRAFVRVACGSRHWLLTLVFYSRCYQLCCAFCLRFVHAHLDAATLCYRCCCRSSDCRVAGDAGDAECTCRNACTSCLVRCSRRVLHAGSTGTARQVAALCQRCTACLHSLHRYAPRMPCCRDSLVNCAIFSSAAELQDVFLQVSCSAVGCCCGCRAWELGPVLCSVFSHELLYLFKGAA